MKKLAAVIILLAIMVCSAWAKPITVENSSVGVLQSDNKTVYLDCHGYDGLIVKANVTVKGSSVITVTHKTYDTLSGMTGFVSNPDALTGAYTKISGTIDSATNATPTLLLPIPRNSEDCWVVFDGCSSCVMSVSVVPNEVSK